MKTAFLRRLPRLLAAVLAASPLAARALFGVGDVVFDPDNTAQTINVLHETQQEFDRLGSLLGVSTQQFDQLVALTSAIGNASEAAPFLQPLSPAELQAAVRSIPGLEGASLGALFNPSSQLDAFMGVPLGQWIAAVESPNAFFQAILAAPALARTGISPGTGPATSTYAQWYAARTPEDQLNLGSRSAADLSDLMAGDWLQNARQRRVNLQGLAAGGQDAQAKAAQAQTVSDQGHAQAQISAGTNAILLESAVQNADASEATVRALNAQNQILSDQEDARRNADELRLDAPP